jgi:Transcriptional Coactivator p15 (PC4)
METMSEPDATCKSARVTINSDVDALVIDEWPVNKREFARVILRRFSGRWLVDIRRWYRGDDGELCPGNKGISLPIEHFPRLADGLGLALQQARDRGLIKTDDEGKHRARLLAVAAAMPRHVQHAENPCGPYAQAGANDIAPIAVETRRAGREILPFPE